MIDLSKKYKTESGGEVKLYEIIGDTVMGARQNSISGTWYSDSWSLTGVNSASGLNLVEVPKLSLAKFEQEKIVKDVVYFSYVIEVPVWTKYIFVSFRGYVYASKTKPEIDFPTWNFMELEKYQMVGKFNFIQGPWQDSLVEV